MPSCERCGSADVVQTLLPKGKGVAMTCVACGHVPGKKDASPAQGERNDAGYKRWKKAVQKRDGYCCQMCGKKSPLETHHIRRWTDNHDLRYDPTNGITLCYDCHHSIQDREDDFIEQFTAKVRENAARDPALFALMRKYMPET